MSLKEDLIAARASFNALAAQCNEPEIGKIRQSFRSLAHKLGVTQSNRFSPEAISAIIAGLGAYKWSKWKEIRDSSPLLADRTPRDIKDKVARLISKYKKKDGNVPGLSQRELEILKPYATEEDAEDSVEHGEEHGEEDDDEDDEENE